MNLYIKAICSIWKDLLFKIAGSLFPFYLGAFILLFLNREEIGKVFDPQSFILYSSSFLFSTMYLWYKTLDNKKNELISFLLFIILSILIALLYSFSLTSNAETLNVSGENNTNISKWSFFIFFATLFFYVFYECKDWIKKKNAQPFLESENQYISLKDSFKNLNEDE